MNKKLPDLHKQAFKFKNSKKLQHDGGRAWIKDSQLYDARSGANGRLQTIDKQIKPADVKEQGKTDDLIKSI